MIELSNQRPHTDEEIRRIWPNCYVWMHSYEHNQDNPNLNMGIPYLIIEEKDLGVVNRRLSEFPQYDKNAIISTFTVGPGMLSNYAMPGVDYGQKT